ncbi:hypothetical protein SAMN05661080_01099 [Modestobacter sp. DSM 44400]|uniref:hypothetical protein n=1 Tax=Modestobacter sp. DSM 44400 TaxID=1550230 RepID=UPI000897F931|nr:hypothetical protein [Modestobacter sp. DSM 44400]SDX76115.1 hypothetical protein SAMN05661080_01099 [Modestobacter sp. DSM 44400]
MDLADVADELYGVPPGDFVAARTVAQDRARTVGEKALAAGIGALPKPSTAAWVCNLLVRAQRKEIVQLVELGGAMRGAQLSLSGEQLKELGRQRAQVIAALTRQARALAHRQGHDVSSAIAEQVEGTLRAAVADSVAGEALLGGQLTAALSYTGLGPVDLGGAAATPVGVAKRTPAPAAKPGKAPKSGRDAKAGENAAARERAAEEQRRRDAEEQRCRELAQAEQDVEESAAVARDAAAAAEAAGQRVEKHRARAEELQARVAELTDELRCTEQKERRAATDVTEAERRRDAAARRAETAASIRDRSQARFEQLRAADG